MRGWKKKKMREVEKKKHFSAFIKRRRHEGGNSRIARTAAYQSPQYSKASVFVKRCIFSPVSDIR